MNELKTQNAVYVQNTDFTFNGSMFSEFVAFIDRGDKTTRTYLTNLKQFAAWLKYMIIEAPTRQDIISYRDYLGKEHEAIQLDNENVNGWSYRTDSNGEHIIIKCKANTIAQYLRSVCQFFKWTAANGYYPNIAENIHAPKINNQEHKKEALTAADVLAIEESIKNTSDLKATEAANNKKDTEGRINRATEQGKRTFAMYSLAVNAGLRTIELSRANVKDIEVKGGTAYMYIYGKGHSEADQKKVLAPGVYEAIQDYLKSRTDKVNGNSPLFVSTGNRSNGKRIAATTISKMLKQAMIEAGYNSERLTAHSLRHTAGTNTMNITGDLYTTQKYMRHSNPATTEIYLHCETEEKESNIAQQLYNLYHNITNETLDINSFLKKLNNEQMKQLTAIAAAMAN